MEISTTNYIHGAQSLQGTHRTMAAKENPVVGSQQSPIRDDLQLSDEASKVTGSTSSESSSTGIRFELVNRIKAEIADGSYETPDKMDIALDRLLAGMTAR